MNMFGAIHCSSISQPPILTPRRNDIDEFEGELLTDATAAVVVVVAAMIGGDMEMDPCNVVVMDTSGREGG